MGLTKAASLCLYIQAFELFVHEQADPKYIFTEAFPTEYRANSEQLHILVSMLIGCSLKELHKMSHKDTIRAAESRYLVQDLDF